MAHKRKAVEAFANKGQGGQLSAFAAARLAKQPKQVSPAIESAQTAGKAREPAATVIAEVPYDGRPSDLVSIHDVSGLLPLPLKPGSSVSLSSPGIEVKPITEDDIEHGIEVGLQLAQRVTIVGEYDVEVIKGAVSLYGAVLHPGSGSQRVFAPSVHGLPQIVARADDNLLHISSVRSSFRKLEKIFPLFRNIWSDSQQHTFSLLHSSVDDPFQRNFSLLEVEKPMQVALSRIAVQTESNARSTRVMAVGAKSSGKSTFNRLLCNTILARPKASKCLYLDLDPGQPEFGPPGTISLVEVVAPILGPPFTHPASSQSRPYRLIRSHAIAATTFKYDAAHYMACARELAQHADRRYPLVVNSCGWVNGLGASVLLDLLLSLSISDVVILEPIESGFMEGVQQACTDATIHRLPRQAPRPSSRTPAESRNMQTMAYMHHVYSKSTQAIRWSCKPINSVRPWTVGYSGNERGIYAILSYGQELSPEYLGEVLDGSLVAVVTCEESTLPEAFGLHDSTQPSSVGGAATPDDLIQRTAEGLPYIVPLDDRGISIPLNPAHSQCVGLALIRSIDTAAKRLQLVMPLSESDVAALARETVVLVRGSFDPPTWAYLEDIYRGEEQQSDSAARPWVSKRDMVGVEGAVWRLRHPPMASAATPR